MSDYPRFTLNRGMVILRCMQPFADWLNANDPMPRNFSLVDINEEGNVFLVPSYDSLLDPVEIHQDAVKWVEKRWRMFFEHMLNDWLTDESLWPKNRTLKMFREWFAVEYSPMVWDMGNEPLAVEDWDGMEGGGGLMH